MDENEIVNRVANSSLVTFNLEEHVPVAEIIEIDLKNILFQGLILREADIREYVKKNDWAQYKGKVVAVHCSADAVIPTWAYMLVTISLQPYAERIIFGNPVDVRSILFREVLDRIDWTKFKDAKVVIKGCSDQHVPESAYMEAAARLRPWASSIMYGEPCSTVPLYKKQK